jgi:hypothetical protein
VRIGWLYYSNSFGELLIPPSNPSLLLDFGINTGTTVALSGKSSLESTDTESKTIRLFGVRSVFSHVMGLFFTWPHAIALSASKNGSTGRAVEL